MSAFLPEGSKTPSLQSPGVAQPTNPEVTDEDLKLMQRVLTAASQYPNMIPDQFMSYLVDFVQTSGLIIPIGQVFGFSQYTAQVAPLVAATETTTSATPADLTTVGPTLTALGPGRYILFWGSDAETSSTATQGAMSVMQGPTFASSIAGGAVTSTLTVTSIMKFAFVTLTADSTDLKAMYSSSNGVASASFANRSLAALKYANL